MSTGWYLTCDICKATSHDDIHNPDILFSLIKAWPHILALRETDTTGYLDVKVMAHEGADFIIFLGEHAAHGVGVMNEYGEPFAEWQAREAANVPYDIWHAHRHPAPTQPDPALLHIISRGSAYPKEEEQR